MLAGMLSVKEKKGLLVAYHVLHDDAEGRARTSSASDVDVRERFALRVDTAAEAMMITSSGCVS